LSSITTSGLKSFTLASVLAVATTLSFSAAANAASGAWGYLGNAGVSLEADCFVTNVVATRLTFQYPVITARNDIEEWAAFKVTVHAESDYLSVLGYMNALAGAELDSQAFPTAPPAVPIIWPTPGAAPTWYFRKVQPRSPFSLNADYFSLTDGVTLFSQSMDRAIDITEHAFIYVILDVYWYENSLNGALPGWYRYLVPIVGKGPVCRA